VRPEGQACGQRDKCAARGTGVRPEGQACGQRDRCGARGTGVRAARGTGVGPEGQAWGQRDRRACGQRDRRAQSWERRGSWSAEASQPSEDPQPAGARPLGITEQGVNPGMAVGLNGRTRWACGRRRPKRPVVPGGVQRRDRWACARSGIAGSCTGSDPGFRGINCQAVFRIRHRFALRAPASPNPGGGEMVSLYGFDLHFPSSLMVLSILACIY
jgi:hypothetical protein